MCREQIQQYDVLLYLLPDPDDTQFHVILPHMSMQVLNAARAQR